MDSLLNLWPFLLYVGFGVVLGYGWAKRRYVGADAALYRHDLGTTSHHLCGQCGYQWSTERLELVAAPRQKGAPHGEQSAAAR